MLADKSIRHRESRDRKQSVFGLTKARTGAQSRQYVCPVKATKSRLPEIEDETVSAVEEITRHKMTVSWRDGFL